MNNVLSQEDKRRSPPYPQWLIAGFQSVAEDCELHNVDLEGYLYTWDMGYGTNGWIEVRLDQALVSNMILQKFIKSRLTNLEVSTSDHCPIFFDPTVTIRVNPIK